jgi:hypothetical protein
MSVLQVSQSARKIGEIIMIDEVIKSEGPATPDKWLPRSFHAPEGRRNSAIDEARRFDVEGKEAIRVVYKMASSPEDEFTFMAGKNYYATKRRSADEALLDDLFKIMGGAVRELQRPDGTVDLDRIVGIEANLNIVHQQSNRYDDPYCRIVSIKPKVVEPPVVQAQAYKSEAEADLLWELKGYGLN